MPTSLLRSSLLLAALLGSSACTRVPGTGRLQLNYIPESLMEQLGKSTYQDTLSQSKVDKTGDDADVLTKVGKRIAKVTGKNYEWKYRLIEDKGTVNAWCLPGGKIAFYTGILPVLDNEAGMAFVMGHEVGHAIAKHGAERMSQQLAILGGIGGLQLYLDDKSKMSDEKKNLIIAALGAGAEVGVLLPFSRKQESEADQLGMMYMAGAGYPPSEAVSIWDRMEKITGGSKTPAFLSDHPSDSQRKARLKDLLPKAKKRYERNKLSGDPTKSIW